MILVFSAAEHPQTHQTANLMARPGRRKHLGEFISPSPSHIQLMLEADIGMLSFIDKWHISC